MSIYEASITNPKKQLEFYKDLSEQLQQENKHLKDLQKDMDKQYAELESVLDEIREGIKHYSSYKTASDLLEHCMSDLEQILDKVKK